MKTDCHYCGSVSGKRKSVIDLRLKKKLLSLNEVGTNAKPPGGRKYRTERTWYTKKLAAWTECLPATGFRQVTITRQYCLPDREYDYDNLVGGCKPIVDAMRKTGLLVNDKRKDVVVRYMQEQIDNTANYVLIEIEEFE